MGRAQIIQHSRARGGCSVMLGVGVGLCIV